MKKRLAAVLTACFLLTACSSGQNAATSATNNETAAVATTEATTTTTEATTTTAETTLPDTPEVFADVACFTGDYKEALFATEFDFGTAVLYKDTNGVRAYPNYPAGQDIKLSFKCDKKLKWGEITRSPYFSKSQDSKEVSIAKIDYGDKGYTTNISKFLKYKDGIYTLTIPAKYAVQDNEFRIVLATDPEFSDYDGKDWLTFYVCCVNETKLATQSTYNAEDVAVEVKGIKASDYVFRNAKCEVVNDGHKYLSLMPVFPEGQDIVITFKCNESIQLISIRTWNLLEFVKTLENKEIEIPIKNAVVNSDGTYTVTIPAKYAVKDCSFDARFVGKNEKEETLCLNFRCPESEEYLKAREEFDNRYHNE